MFGVEEVLDLVFLDCAKRERGPITIFEFEAARFMNIIFTPLVKFSLEGLFSLFHMIKESDLARVCPAA